ncbi:MAG: hypothetical protein JO120_09310, partial [Solirubrobacterales bacterium]|nr:hypothetical protein [Solirubrobacterales bacterium]
YGVRGYEAPQGELERRLAGLWAELLQLERVGRQDHFFELGGHSLLAVKLVSRLRQAVGVEVTLAELFARPVLADLAQALESAARVQLPPITASERSAPLPVSFAQQRLWFLAQMEGVSAAYHIAGGLRLLGELDRAALRRALDRIVARHEVLRTSFLQVDGQPVQRIASEDCGFALREHDWRSRVAAGRAEAERELEGLVREEALVPFDLEQGPLIRGRLMQLGAEEHILLITMHHIVSDGWSMGVLTRELSALYRAFRRGQADPLPALSIQYADYAAWQRRWLSSEAVQAQAEYWKTTLAGAPVLLELPGDHARPAQQDHAGDVVEVVLEQTLTRGLKRLSQRHGTTLFMTLLSGWAVLLARLSGQQDLLVGTPVANRGRVEVEGLIGFFVNTLALRLDVSGEPTVRDLLARVKGQVLAAQQHQDLPFEQVVEMVQPPRSLAHSPLFQVMFAWQNAAEETLELPGLKLAPLAVPAVAAKFDLTLSLREAGQAIVGGLEYATALFERGTIERYLGYWRRLLEAMVADDDQVVDRLPLLDSEEQQPLTSNRKPNRRALPASEAGTQQTRGYEAPQGELETRLASLWAELLHLRRVGRHDHFFELGGHSLLALRMVTMLERADIKTSLVALFQHPTIASLATHITQQETQLPDYAGSSAIPVKISGTERPLFLVHEFQGLVAYAAKLAPYIDAEIPVYALPAKPVNQTQLYTIEGIAAHHVRNIRAVQPVGPYRIAGWSFGGIIAYEIAKQLIGQDQTVEFLGLLDTYWHSHQHLETFEQLMGGNKTNGMLLFICADRKSPNEIRVISRFKSIAAGMKFEE